MAAEPSGFSEQAPGETIAKLSLGVVLFDEVQELDVVRSVHPLQVLAADPVAELAQVGAGVELPDQLDSGGVELLEAVGVVGDEVDPRRASTPPGPDQRPIVSGRGEAHLDQGVRRALPVQLLVQRQEAVAHLPHLLERDGELEFLVLVIDRAVERLRAVHDQVRSALGHEGQPVHVRGQPEKTAVREKVAHGSSQPRVERDGPQLGASPFGVGGCSVAFQVLIWQVLLNG